MKKTMKVKFIFDMRGFWADERVDGGIWKKNSILFRIAKWFEKQFLLNADHIVSLTKSGRNEILKFPYLLVYHPKISVIPTCANLDHFKLTSHKNDGFVFGYVGSVGTWYLFDVTVKCFALLLKLKPNSKLLIINRNEHAYIKSCLIKGGVPLESVEIASADHADMPEQISRMHASIFFIKPVFSKQASAPTKLGEILGCGVPCISNWGVGDMAEILEGDGVGVAVSQFNDAELEAGLLRLIALTHEPDIAERCMASAIRNFSLDNGVAQYKKIYKSMVQIN
jgi:glycosyltransferase involved in cell wall biosynthesis